MAKFLVNQRIKIVNEFNTTNKLGMVGYVERIDPNDSTLTYRIRLDGRHPTEWEWVREQDIEPETIVGKTLAQVKAELDALKVQEEGAHAALATTLKSIAEHREKLRAELEGFGLGIIGGQAVAALVAPTKTLGELYHSNAVQVGDVFTFNGPVDKNRDWEIGKQYRVEAVDTDESVLLEAVHDEDNYEWAWENEGAFVKFVKAA